MALNAAIMKAGGGAHCAPKSDVVAAIALSGHKELAKVGCAIRAQLALDLHCHPS